MKITAILFFHLNSQAAAEIGLRGGPEENTKDEGGSDSGGEDVGENPEDEENSEDEVETVRETESRRERQESAIPVAQASSSQPTPGERDFPTDDDEEDELAPMDNATFRPFQDEAARQHVNHHLMEAKGQRQRSSNSISSTASTIDPRVVRHKVMSQMKQKQKKQAARRVRKSGEAAVITRKRRENMEAIQHSAGWD